MARPPRVFISRTTAGLKALAEQVAEVLRRRGIELIIQTGFYPSTHDVKGMWAKQPKSNGRKERKTSKKEGTGCTVFCFFRFFRPHHGLKDPRTKDRLFSYTQIELLIARDLGRPERNPNDECRMSSQTIRHSSFRIRHCPASLGTLFKGRDEFVAELRQHLTAEGPAVIQGKRTIHGMGGVVDAGKTTVKTQRSTTSLRAGSLAVDLNILSHNTL